MDAEHRTKTDWAGAPTLAGKPAAASSTPAGKLGLLQRIRKDRIRSALFEKSPPERRLGRFLVVGRLGRGGMGTVLEAYDQTLDRRVAVKHLHEDTAGQHHQRLLREAQALARLSHPNVVQIYDAGEAEGRLFIAMELVSGRTLWEWQREPHPWRECLDAYAQAARGLAAAHAEGIVHRDFKPANCIIGEDGRVKVLDFGLARGVDDLEQAEPDVQPPTCESKTQASDSKTQASDSVSQGSEANLSALSLELTRTGAMLGTPAYMAPEQTLGEPADARSDQFSLCVALYEALYGERPFDGPAGLALLASDHQPPYEPTRSHRGQPPVPAWLRRLLARGMSTHKESRFASMDALLAVVEQHHGRRRGKLGALVLGLVLAGGIGTAAALHEAPCQGLADAAMPTWGDEQRTAVRQALLATSADYAEDAWASTRDGLDAYARDWAAARAQACEATRIEHSAGEQMLELRMACLERLQPKVRATVDLLTGADAPVAAHAAQAVRSLPPVTPCLDAEALRRGPRPLPPELRAPAGEVRARIAQSWASYAAGQAAAGIAVAEQALTDAEALGPAAAALQTEAQYNRGRLYRAVLRRAEARHDLEAVLERAEQSDDQELAIDALRELLEVAADNQAAFDAWMPLFRGKLRRVEDRPRHRAELHLFEGRQAAAHDEHRAAIEHFQAAEGAYRELGPGVAIARVKALMELGAAQAELNEDPRAQRSFEDALALAEREGLLPMVARANQELGGFHYARGRFGEAEAALRRSLELSLASDGPHAPAAIPTRTLLTLILGQRGELDEVEALVEAVRESLGPQVPPIHRAQGHNLVASFDRQQDNWSGALQSYLQARKAWLALPDPDEIELAMLDSNAADCLFHLGELDAARASYQRSQQALEVHTSPEDPRRVYPLMGRGLLLVKQGSPAERSEGIHLLKHALELERRRAPTPWIESLLAWTLGRTILSTPDRTPEQYREALGLIASARPYYEQTHDAKTVAEIDAFLEGCGPRCQTPPQGATP